MTQHKRVKRKIRERMAKTGESYTTARMHMLGGGNGSTPPGGPSNDAAQPPKLLLDAQVFRALVEGSLDQYKDRLRRIAMHRRPPLLWVCPLTFEEIVCHVRPEEAHRFEYIREALSWMDDLCGNDGIAEDLSWTIVAGSFLTPQPFDRAKLAGMNQIRRSIKKTERFSDLRPEILVQVQEKRELYSARRAHHVASFTNVIAPAREAPEPRVKWEPPKEMVAAGVTLGKLRSRHEREYGWRWGPLKTEAEQARDQREIITFDVARLTKGANDPKYNVESHPGDFNDQYLCFYPATGYTLVTGDGRLRRALDKGGCKDPRVVDLARAVEIAETWLAKREAA
jgi:hypothetical protein